MKSRSPFRGGPHPGHRRPHHPDDAFDPREDGPRPGGYGPGGPGGHRHGGPGPRGPRGPRGRGGRAPRGDVRAAILVLLAEEPMHGYQLMQAIADRSGGRWTPSPGAIYPAIAQLEDEGLVTVTAESGRKVVALTDAGREAVAAGAEERPDPFAEADGVPAGPDLRHVLMQLAEAVRTVGRTGTVEQREATAKVLDEARRSIFLLLADGPAPTER
jgi:DNA-binding PadR family transcriptional regulator